MPLADVFADLGIALGLGLLVGLQRESTRSTLGGLRTFPLVTLLGAVCALLVPFAGWAVAAGLVGVAAATAMGNVARLREPEPDPGITTEIALLLMYALGAYVVVGERAVAVALGGVTAVLLHFKAELHGLVRRLGRDEVRALMQFALLALVVLPILPDDEYGPYAVFNPREMWLMVVLIVGLSLGGYIALKFFGENVGVVAGGILGGLVSSTATTVSWSKRTRAEPETSRAAALVILIASTIVYVRVLVEISAVAPSFLDDAAPPILVLMAAMALACAGLWLRTRDEVARVPEGGDPTELKSAFAFAALYVIVLLAVAFVKDKLGTGGLYAVSVVSGLTDVDAITLSVSRLVGSGTIEPGTGWRLVVVAVLSNLVFKGGVAVALGSPRLRRLVAALFASQLVAGGLLLALFG